LAWQRTRDDYQSYRQDSVVVQFRQNLSGQPYVVARSEGRHVGCPYIDAALKSN